MDSYLPIGGTTLTGPVEEWQHPDGYWTEEFGAELTQAQAARRPVTCPICAEPNGAVRTEAIAATTPDSSGMFREFAGNVGTLIVLEGCGHTVKR